MRVAFPTQSARQPVQHFKSSVQSSVFRRTVDAVLAGMTLAALSPVLIGVGVAIRIQMGESPIYAKTRINGDGQPFQKYQLRTMNEARDAAGRLLPAHLRVNELGRLLYATRLYKAPTLWNVIMGDVDSREVAGRA